MNRTLYAALACVLASCGHVATPLPPQLPQEARPIFIINAAEPAANTRASKPKPAMKTTSVPAPTPDVVAIAWALRDTIVWDGRSTAREAVRRVPRRQGVPQSGEPQNKALNRARRGAAYFTPLQCGYGHSGHRVGFSGRNCRWNADDVRAGRCGRDAIPVASTAGSRMRSAAIRAGCRSGSPIAVVPIAHRW
jgi:hypothetical protein